VYSVRLPGFTGPVSSAALDKVINVLYYKKTTMSIGYCVNETKNFKKTNEPPFRKLTCHDIGIIGDLII
jgi:hypothetical protein